MDVEEIADELYGLKPGEFTAARDTYVAQARRTKDAAAAKAIAALRRPALAAWAANQLARQQPDETARFLELGETLRETHRTLDGERLRAAARQQHQLVGALARTSGVLAAEAGQPVSDTVLHEIEQTLHAVLARTDVAEQWSRGRLVKVPEAAVDFAAIAPDEVPARPAPAKPAPAKPAPVKPAAPKKERAGARERRLRDLEWARTAAEEAEAEVGRCERALGEARDALEAAGGQAEEEAGRVRRLEHELQEARKAKSATEAITAEAGTAVKTAERAVREARKAAEQATRAVQRLEDQAEP
ncbi:hypothetical protein ACFU5Y_12335 [Streptomyces gardneri]|uniref:hypothetical protein n=1 Tax=Streptomyces gardneri TaxID=66892 RepID=UPI0036C0C7E8